VFGVGNDWDNPIARTPGSNQTLVHQYMPSVGDTYWVQRTNGPTPTTGTEVTINDVAPTGDRYNLTICEVVPSPSSPVPTPAPPTVSLTAPTSGSTFTAGTSITVSANASAASGATIVKVDFYAGSTVIGTDSMAPYSITWTGAPAGSYSLTAIATDSRGATSRSAAVNIGVNAIPAPSSVQVTLAWDPNIALGLAGYKVYVGTASGAYSVAIDVSNVTSYTVTGLQAGTQYYFAVTAYDSGGNQSGFSNEVSTTP
jgi:hypothetical protein